MVGGIGEVIVAFEGLSLWNIDTFGIQTLPYVLSTRYMLELKG
jgi:hypothetical protein